MFIPCIYYVYSARRLQLVGSFSTGKDQFFFLQTQSVILLVFCRNTYFCVLPDQLVLAKCSSSILTELYRNSSDNPEVT